jgi:2-iminobutanoate/2-iminopropanoate deaminase
MDLTTMAAHVEHLFAAGAPKPIAPFSHATAWGPLLFVTGQMPIIAETGEYVRGTFAEQTDAVMRNLETMLKAAGSDWSRVLPCEDLSDGLFEVRGGEGGVREVV